MKVGDRVRVKVGFNGTCLDSAFDGWEGVVTAISDDMPAFLSVAVEFGEGEGSWFGVRELEVINEQA